MRVLRRVRQSKMARVLFVGVLLTAAGVLPLRDAGVHAAALDMPAEPDAQAPSAGIEFDVDGDEDDDRVEVQLLVLGTVVVVVFVLGTGAYLLRRRLGLTAYTPPADAGHH